MEPIKLTLNAPITEYCPKCEYEESRSFNSYRGACPECGCTSIRRGPRYSKELPMTVSVHKGRYNLLSTDQQWSYVFNHVPNGKTYQFILKEEVDDCDAVECAINIKNFLEENYMFHSSKKDVEELVNLFTDEEIERQEKLNAFEKVKKLKNELYEMLHKNPELI